MGILASIGQWVAAEPLAVAGLLVLSYLLGSIPTAVWISRLGYGQDIRTQGSGNAGSTNTYRVLGFWPGLVVQVVDIAKGSVAALLPLLMVGWFARVAGMPEAPLTLRTLQFLCGVVAVLGHIYPVLAGFRGGKGMNTLLGMMVVVLPWAALWAVGAFLGVLLLTHMVSAASILATWTLPVYLAVAWGFSSTDRGVLFGLGLLIPLLVMYTHRTNLTRMRRGTESKVGFLARNSGSNP